MLNNRLLDFTAFRQICQAWKSVKLVQLTCVAAYFYYSTFNIALLIL